MVERLKSKFDRIHFSAKTYKWNTPQDLFQELNEEFHFNFDPARPAIIGNYDENALTKRWAIKNSNAKLRVYLNPPYDRKLMERFIKKSWQEMCEDRIELVVFLLPLRASALRFLIKIKKDVEFRLLLRRVFFGDAVNGAPFDSVVAILQK
jgi:site-specific DNA-methyltransferase (adenine-specific)